MNKVYFISNILLIVSTNFSAIYVFIDIVCENSIKIIKKNIVSLLYIYIFYIFENLIFFLLKCQYYNITNITKIMINDKL